MTSAATIKIAGIGFLLLGIPVICLLLEKLVSLSEYKEKFGSCQGYNA
jgi:TM2 domain-containing membrane protein YozV